MINQVLVVIISMLLFFRNRATNAFQLVVGMFLSSSGASRRIIDTFNQMGLSVSYQWVPSPIARFSVIYLPKMLGRFKGNCVHSLKMPKFEPSPSPQNPVVFGVWYMIISTSHYKQHLSGSTQQPSS